MRHIAVRRGFLAIVVTALILSFGAAVSNVGADPLDDFRNAGVVGERFDGYLEIRDSSAGTDVQDLVGEVNERRRAVYERRASEQGVSPGAIGRVYAQRILSDVASGVWFKGEDGRWTQK